MLGRLLVVSFTRVIVFALPRMALVTSLRVAWCAFVAVLIPPRGQVWPMGGTSPKARAAAALAGLGLWATGRDASTPITAVILFFVMGFTASDMAGQLPVAWAYHCHLMGVVLTRYLLLGFRTTVARLPALGGGGTD